MSDERKMVISERTVFASARVDDTNAMHEAASAVVGMFEAACTGELTIPEDAPTKDALEDTQEAPAADEREPVMVAVHDIARRHDLSLEDVAAAFISVRPHLSTDEQTVTAIDAVAELYVTSEKVRGDVSLSDMALDMVHASKGIANAKQRRIVMKTKPALVDAQGNVVRLPVDRKPSARIEGASIVVEGGAPAPNLPPAIEYDGKVDPNVEAMIAAGKSAYHLDTLEQLENEAKEADAAVDALTSDRSDVAPEDPNGARVFRGTPSMRSPATAVLTTLGMAALVAGLRMPEAAPPTPPPRPPVRGQGRTPRTVRARPMANHARGEAVAGACGSVGCRTLGSCICDCRKCRAGCPRKA